jgi:16S rRNA (uracil1498-N3)-methyltransferase
MKSKLQRLFIEAPLATGAELELSPAHAHYLINVLRSKGGEHVLVFNGRDGEWRAELFEATRKRAKIRLEARTRPQIGGPDLHYLFAPLKRARLDYLAQKATEMGASLLQPVITRHTVAERVNVERLHANAIEAAEQCGILRVPEIGEPQTLAKLLADWNEKRLLVFADEEAPCASPLDALNSHASGPLAVLIGPEGGFAADERALLMQQRQIVPVSLGPRVMRADTAAVACLALVNAVLGDWR